MGRMSALIEVFRKRLKFKMTKEGGKMAEKGGNDNSEIILINRVLPPEMLEKIFGFLAPKDLNNVMLVCKTWNNVGEAPVLWSCFKITKRSQLTLRRLQGCQEIVIGHAWSEIGNMFSWGWLCQTILQYPGLKKITLRNSEVWERMRLSDDWFIFDVDYLTQTFAKMEEIEIHKLGSRRFQVQANEGVVTKCVVEAILDRPNNLKRLVLNNVSYNLGVRSLRLVTALNKIEILEVDLNGEADVNLLFKTMMQEKTSVTSLSLLRSLVLSELEPEYLFGVFDKLKEIDVNAGDDDEPPLNHLRQPDMVKTLCEKIAAGTNLKILRLKGFHDLSQVSRSSLSRMVTQLEELELSSANTEISRNDIVTIVRTIATNETSNLKKLTIRTALRSVDSRLLAKMATNVHDLRLHFAVDEGQVRAIFGTIATGPGWGKLRRMTLFGCSRLHRLDADILASAVNNLESFELNYQSFLTVHQTERILTVAKKTRTLKKLSTWVNYTIVPGYTSFLDPLVTEAEKIIPDLNIEKACYFDVYSDLDDDFEPDPDYDIYQQYY